MNIFRTPEFEQDVSRQQDWYLYESGMEPEHAIELVARFAVTIEQAIDRLGITPQLGHSRFKSHPDFARLAIPSSGQTF